MASTLLNGLRTFVRNKKWGSAARPLFIRSFGLSILEFYSGPNLNSPFEKSTNFAILSKIKVFIKKYKIEKIAVMSSSLGSAVGSASVS